MTAEEEPQPYIGIRRLAAMERVNRGSILHNVSAAEFWRWLRTIPEEDQETVLLFIPRLVLDFDFPDVSLCQLRGFIKGTYGSRPNRTWDQLTEEFVEEAEEGGRE